MADHITEEEQIQAIKRWWNDNWLTLVLPILLLLSGYVGWNYWQQQKIESAKLASDKYQALVEIYDGSGEISESQGGKALAYADDIMSAHSGSLYADLSALLAARVHVERNNLDEAGKLLKAVVENDKHPSATAIAQVRLAKVLLAQGDHDAAAVLVTATDKADLISMYAEVRGDIAQSRGDDAAAREAYQQAIAGLGPQQAAYASILQFKLQGLAQAQADDTTAAQADAE